MVKRLKSLWVNPIASRLLLKIALVLGAFLGVRFFGFSFSTIFSSAIVFLLIYFLESPERTRLRSSFFVSVFFGFVALSQFLSSSFSISLAANFVFFLVLGIIFFIIFGLTAFIFTNRFLAYGLFNTVLLVFIFLTIQFLSWSFLVSSLILFITLALIFHETFLFFSINLKDRIWFASFILGLLALELSWLLVFLPLGVINSAVFLALFFLLVRDTLLVHFQGHLNLSFVFRELTFFVFLSIIIFAASKWTI